MTNEEAIAWLKGLKANEILSATKEALDIAIKALEFINENYPNTFIDYLNGVQLR